MSLKAIKAAFCAIVHDNMDTAKCTKCRMRAEIAALEKAAKDLTRLHLGDGVDRVAHSEKAISEMTDDPKNQWYHPDVTAWGEAAALLEAIAKEAK